MELGSFCGVQLIPNPVLFTAMARRPAPFPAGEGTTGRQAGIKSDFGWLSKRLLETYHVSGARSDSGQLEANRTCLGLTLDSYRLRSKTVTKETGTAESCGTSFAGSYEGKS